MVAFVSGAKELAKQIRVKKIIYVLLLGLSSWLGSCITVSDHGVWVAGNLKTKNFIKPVRIMLVSIKNKL
jgi:hypothetical protein